MENYKVVATTVTFGKLNREPVERLADAGCEVITNKLGRPYNEDELINIAKDADAIIVGNDDITEKVIDRCTNLKVIAKHGVGVDNINIPHAYKKGIVVTNAPSTNAQEVADLAFSLMLALARNLYPSIRELKAKRWIKTTGNGMDGKTIGILGLGAIGRCSVQRAKGFGMRILGYDINENAAAKAMNVEFASLDKIIEEADFITLHLPLTDNTKHIINKDTISKMKDNVIIVNTARNGLVDLCSIEEALKSGKIKGFATDVYDSEPPEFIDLYNMDNVILTPHIGGTTYESNLKMGNRAVDNVLAVLSGKEAPNVVKC